MGRGRRPCKDTEQPAAQLENAECVVWPNCSVLEAADQETAPMGMSCGGGGGGGWPQAVEQPQRESESSALSQAELSVLLNAHSRNSETGVPGLTMN